MDHQIETAARIIEILVAKDTRELDRLRQENEELRSSLQNFSYQARTWEDRAHAAEEALTKFQVKEALIAPKDGG